MKAMHHPYLAALLLSMSAKAAADRLADPTRPPQASDASASPSQEGVRVEAVLRSKERDLAIVNGKIVRAGDRVGGVQIEAILVDGIRYVRDGQVHIARLQPVSIPVRR
jgi:MSHA biogenesis protein MshK